MSAYWRPGTYRHYPPVKRGYLDDDYERTNLRAYYDAKRAKAGTLCERAVFSVNGYTNYTFKKDESYSNVNMFSTFYGRIDKSNDEPYSDYLHGAVTTNKSFRLKCAQYDQCRLISMVLKITPSSDPTSVIPVNFLSVVDRNASLVEVAGWPDNREDYIMSAREIMENPGVIISNITGKAYKSVNRYCIASNVKEKTKYIDTTLNYNAIANTNIIDIRNQDWLDKNCSFAPCFFTCMHRTFGSDAATYRYSYSVEFIFEFRNPKNNLEDFLAKELTFFPNTVTSSVIRFYEDSQKDKTPSHDAVLPS